MDAKLVAVMAPAVNVPVVEMLCEPNEGLIRDPLMSDAALLMAVIMLVPAPEAIVGLGKVPAKSPPAAPVGAGAFCQLGIPAFTVNT